MKALLLENIHPEGVRLLTERGIEVELVKGALDEPELIAALPGVQLLGIRSKTNVTTAALAAAPDLMAIGAFCIGTNQIDLTAAGAHGVAVFNAPFSNTRSVVELVIGEIVALTRRLTDKNTEMHAGVWNKSAAGAHEIRGRSLGIVGYGNIGSQLSVVAEALGLSVGFYDSTDKLALGNARRYGSLDELLAASDIVTLHVDGRPGNSGLFGENEFAQMRDGAIFLNLSRGFVVDHGSLRKHIETAHLSGASVDVFPVEPHAKGEGFVSELRGLANVILTPHVGGSTEEAQEDIGRFVGGKLRTYVRDGGTALSVNLPTLELPARDGAHRIAHLHQNTPGVLAATNRILADAGVNIDAQFLGTRDNVGYAITDVGDRLPDKAVRALCDMPQTLRVRTLS